MIEFSYTCVTDLPQSLHHVPFYVTVDPRKVLLGSRRANPKRSLFALLLNSHYLLYCIKFCLSTLSNIIFYFFYSIITVQRISISFPYIFPKRFSHIQFINSTLLLNCSLVLSTSPFLKTAVYFVIVLFPLSLVCSLLTCLYYNIT